MARRRKNPPADPVYLGVFMDEDTVPKAPPLGSSAVVWRPRYQRYEMWVFETAVSRSGAVDQWIFVGSTKDKAEAVQAAKDTVDTMSNPLLPLPPDFFPKASAVRDNLKKIRQDLYEKTGQWFSLNDVGEALKRADIAHRRSLMRVVPGGKRRANPRRRNPPTGQRTYTVTVMLRKDYPTGEDIYGALDSKYSPEIERVTEEVDKKVPASVPGWEYVSIVAQSATTDRFDFAGNIAYKLRVTVVLED